MNKLKNKKVLMITAICFIVLLLIIIVLFFSKSYALNGFGTINLSCDKTLVSSEEEISCTMTGTVSPESQVSSLEAQLELSSDLELMNITVDSIWEGSGADGNIQLYTDVNKSGTFNIATFTLKVKGDLFNTTKSINIKDIKFYDNTFAPQSIENTELEILTPTFTSDKYDLTKDYIITYDKSIENIISNINQETTTCYVDDNLTTGTIKEGSKLNISYNDNLLKSYDIVYVGSNIYDLSKEYIIDSSNDIDTINNNIEVINGTSNIKNNKVIINYKDTGIKEYDLLSIYSTKYLINISNSTIIIDNEINDDILNNIVKTDNVALSINDNNLDIIYNDKTIKTLNIIKLNSSEYDINLINKYIYIPTANIDKNKINISDNISINIDNNKLNIIKDNITVDSFNIIKISSDKYKIDNNSNYIYTGNTNNLEEIKENISTINSNITLDDTKLQLNNNNNLVKEFNILNISSNSYEFKDSTLYINGVTEYNTFINNLTFNGVTYKILDNNDTEITTGNIDDNYKLNIYKDSTLLDTYNIKVEYLNISNDLNVTEDTNVIYKINNGTKYNDLLTNINTSGSISIKDSEGNNVDKDDIVKTGDIISVKLSSETKKYTVSVKGDIAGDGNVNVGDVAKLYQYIKKKITMDESSLLAAELTGDNEVNVGDVAKLYQFIKKRINSLD